MVEMRSMSRRRVEDSLKGPKGLESMRCWAMEAGLDANSSTYCEEEEEDGTDDGGWW